MVALDFVFTARRYQASSWTRGGKGIPEWPPSPWRILRALIAVWHRAAPDVPAADVATLLPAFAGPPRFMLPAAILTQPVQIPARALAERDVAVLLPPDDLHVLVCWAEARLTPPQRELLGRLADHLPYLGRAESWCRATLLPQDARVGDIPFNAYPAETGATPGADQQLVRVLCAAPQAALGDLEQNTGYGAPDGQHGEWTPRGSCWCTYVRPALTVRPTPVLAPSAARGAAQIVRLGVDVGVPAGARVAAPLPDVTATLSIGDLARRAAMSQFGRGHAGNLSPTLSGRQGSTVLEHQHRHAHYLPTDEDGDGFIDHLTIWSPGGMDPAELSAVCAIRELRGPEWVGRRGLLSLRPIESGGAVVRRALRVLEAVPGDTVMVGDRAHDVVGSRACGVTATMPPPANWMRPITGHLRHSRRAAGRTTGPADLNSVHPPSPAAQSARPAPIPGQPAAA